MHHRPPWQKFLFVCTICILLVALIAFAIEQRIH